MWRVFGAHARPRRDRRRIGANVPRLIIIWNIATPRPEQAASLANKRVLMIAFHVPPLRGSSGIQRTLGFARYLPELGWTPEVLSAHPRAYEAVDDADSLPRDLVVHRAFALDTARHLALRGQYPSLLALPDRWVTWWPGAVVAGLRLVRRVRPDVLWSTYPIASAHAIGHTLARLTGIRWVADFRDPMAQDGYPAEPAVWRSFSRIEARTVARAHYSVFTTPGAARQYRQRYPQQHDRIRVIENGYDDEAFSGLRPMRREVGRERLLLLHSGIVYPSERDPAALFAALGALRERGVLDPQRFALRFRAPIHGRLLRDLASRHDVADLVEIAEPLPYRAALAEMLDADGLVVLQAANCNEQIPAKLYEYLRAGRPILGLADPAGDTAGAMRRAGVAHIAALEDVGGVTAVLERFVDDLRSGRAPCPDGAVTQAATRRARASELASLLNAAAGA